MRSILIIRIALMASFCLAGNAWAINIGTISVTGVVGTGTCAANISGVADYIVTLDTVATAVLATAGATAGSRAFTISLSNCNLVGNKNVVPYFLAINGSVNENGRLKNMYGAGAATNVDIQMLNESSAVMDLSKASGSQNAGVVNVPTAGGAGAVSYTLRYYATAAAGAGSVSSSMTWGIDYN